MLSFFAGIATWPVWAQRAKRPKGPKWDRRVTLLDGTMEQALALAAAAARQRNATLTRYALRTAAGLAATSYEQRQVILAAIALGCEDEAYRAMCAPLPKRAYRAERGPLRDYLTADSPASRNFLPGSARNSQR